MLGVLGERSSRISLVKIILNILGWFLCVLIVNSILISISSFFHFSLGHNFFLIEEWLHQKGWEFLLISKLISLWLMRKFIAMNSFNQMPLKHYIRENWGRSSYPLWVLIFFLNIFIIAFGRISFSGFSFEILFHTFFSAVGLVTFIGVDFLILCYLLDSLSVKSQTVKILSCLFYGVIFLLTFRVIAPYASARYVTLYLHFVIIFVLFFKTKSLKNSLLFLLLHSVFYESFLGRDPIWGEVYSIFKIHQDFGLKQLVILYGISFFYVFFGITNNHYLSKARTA